MLNDIRGIIADKLLLWALRIAPSGDAKPLAVCLHAYFADSLRRRGYPSEKQPAK